MNQLVERIADSLTLALKGQLSNIAMSLDIGPIIERYLEAIRKGKHIQGHRQSADFGIDKTVIDKLAMGFSYPSYEILTK